MDKRVKIMNKSNTWGGKRPNAGRKKSVMPYYNAECRKVALEAIKNAAKEEKLEVGSYLIKQLGL